MLALNELKSILKSSGEAYRGKEDHHENAPSHDAAA